MISALRELESDGFAYPAILLKPQDDFPTLQDLEPSFELPAILVPPEIAHVEDEVSTSAPLVRHRELPIIWVQLFDVEVRVLWFFLYKHILTDRIAQHQPIPCRRIFTAINLRRCD